MKAPVKPPATPIVIQPTAQVTGANTTPDVDVENKLVRDSFATAESETRASGFQLRADAKSGLKGE